jgi:DDE superfamily endonuclease
VLLEAISKPSRIAVWNADEWGRINCADTGIPTLVQRDQGIPFRKLCAILFESISRSDQRHNGMQYLRGLLAVEGRKSARNLARWLGPEVSEQSLHHFINGSSWEWTAVRQALARFLLRTAPPRAWVMHSLVIPKTGQHSIGVGRRFVRSAGRMLNSQQAVGLWAASERMNCPVTWQLLLSGPWLDDAHRVSASIPNGNHPETVDDCMAEMALELTANWRLPALPVILDARETDAMNILRRLRSAHVPVFARIDGNLAVQPAEPVLRGLTPTSISARALLTVFKDMRRMVTLLRESSGVALHTSLVATARVRPPWRFSSRNGTDLLLLGAGERGRPWPEHLWLTDLTEAQPGPLFEMTRLLGHVKRDAERIGGTVGLMDFTGRSFGGWHRHATLASAAYAVTALGGTAMAPSPYSLL